MNEFFRRIGYLFNSNRRQRELQNEMAFHREMAERAGNQGADRRFGNAVRLQEQAREAWGWTWLDRLAQDLGFGARILARSPGFALMAILILAIGIGVNVSAFSLFDAIALKPLPVRDPGSLIRLQRRSPTSNSTEMSYPSFAFYRDHSKTLSTAIGVLGIPPVQVDQDIQTTSATFVTPNYFSELGTQPSYGRLFDPSLDSSPAAPPAVVIGYGFWQRHFGSDPSVIGRAVHINKKPATIVGIMPYAFASLGGQHPDLLMPIAQMPYFVEGSHVLTDFGDSNLRMWGRLAPGVTAKMAEQELRSLTDELRKQKPDAVWDKEFLEISPGGHLQVMTPQIFQVAAMAGVLALLILAVCCANLGGLLLARAVAREHEISIRIAIGANRTRIFRQLCTESLLLAALGSLAGLALGTIVMQVALQALDSPRWISAAPDWRVLLFTMGVTFAAVIFFGLAPALQIVRQRRHRSIARQVLVGAQVAASCVLLIVAGLLVRASRHALYTDPGFGYERLLTIDPQLAHHGYKPGQAKEYLDEMQARLLATPGVEAVSLVSFPPLGHITDRERHEINGRAVLVYPNNIAPGFFHAMGIPVLAGRTFYPGEKNAVIISDSLARQQWPGQNPIGQQLPDDDHKNIVIGVAGDAHINALSEDDAAEMYWAAQPDDTPSMVIVAMTNGSATDIPARARSIGDSLDNKIVPEVRQLKALYRDNVAQVEKVATTVTLIGMVAVVLAGVGIVSLVAFTISQRSKEIAIRLALGSPAAQTLTAVLGQFSWPVLIGMAAGIGITAAFSRLLRFALYGVSNLDFASYGSAAGVLIVAIAFAVLIPARRALRIDIVRTLHEQ